ncbi:hypothetical protein BaRGS_00032533 [Batillaria attramentaria]|uniref:Cytochrome c oxidase assembly protein n=1 Tax=Batillaria attramentaria TaxID=370345 RepID=A0ABD0JMV0_9CAEN
MSTASKVTLGASVTFTIGIITYVHLWQKKERARMREGVIMDLERQLRKRGDQDGTTQEQRLTEYNSEQQTAVQQKSGSS